MNTPASPVDYLERIVRARVYDVAVETPLELAPALSARTHNRILLKREDLQPVFSFKLRGAYNKMAQLSPAVLKRGVICASAGNHAQGVAYSAQKMGVRAIIVMPETAPSIKVDAVAARGAEVVLAGESFTDAYLHARELEKSERLAFVHPFDDPDVIAGQGTIGLEIFRAHSGPLHAVFCPVGGGGLLAGVAACLKRLRPETKIIGVETFDADAMTRSLASGHSVPLDQVGLFSDGTAVKEIGNETLRLASEYVDEMISVNTDAICAAIKDVFEDTRVIPEPAGALAIAGAKAWLAQHRLRDKTVLAICSGANMNFDRLRFVAERAEVGEQREAVLAVTIPERPGAFRILCGLLGKRNVTEFSYRYADPSTAHVFVGVSIHRRADATRLLEHLSAHGFPAVDLTDDDIAKSHIRYMVGGRAPSGIVRDERLYRFSFPERPGALLHFLNQMQPEWNISLFHYRNHGADYSHALVGLQVPDADIARLHTVLDAIGYEYTDESGHPTYRLFLGH